MSDLDTIYGQIGRQYVLNYVAIGAGIGRLKPKNCKKGWNCGYSCQSKEKKNCRSALTGQAKTYTDWLSAQAEKAKQESTVKGVDVKYQKGYSKGSSTSDGENTMVAKAKLTPKQQQALKNVQDNGEVGVVRGDSIHKTYMGLVNKGLLKVARQESIHTWFAAA